MMNQPKKLKFGKAHVANPKKLRLGKLGFPKVKIPQPKTRLKF